MKKLLIALVALALALAAPLAAQDAPKLPRTESVKGATTYIISPANGETVSQTFSVKFGLKGMGVAPAGIVFPGTGHHHLAVDLKKLPPMNQPLPATKNMLHFGGGQTETTLTLPPGKHTLQLVLGDHLHIPHDPPVVSRKITVIVAEPTDK